MNIHIDSHEDTHRAGASMHLLDLVKSWGVWKAGGRKLEKLGKLGWAADGPQMMLRYSKGGFVPGAIDLFLTQSSLI